MTKNTQYASPKGNTLVADVGGTNSRLAIAKGTSLLKESARRFKNSDFKNLETIIAQYVQDSGCPLLGACIAVAGPLIDHQRAKLTNISWDVDATAIGHSLGDIPVSIMNDLQAVGHALHQLHSHELIKVIKGIEPPPDSPRLVINAGTGFNAVAVHTAAGKRFVAPSECGHASLPTSSDATLRLRRHIESLNGFASIEDVLSGRGAQLVRRWVSSPTGLIGASQGEDEAANAYHQILSTILASVSRNLALTHLPFGGIYLTGGLIRAIAPELNSHGFKEQFCQAGRFTEFMAQFSMQVICDDLAALRGCAAAFEQSHGA